MFREWKNTTFSGEGGKIRYSAGGKMREIVMGVYIWCYLRYVYSLTDYRSFVTCNVFVLLCFFLGFSIPFAWMEKYCAP